MDKTKLSESDICDKYIRPAMEQAGWNGLDQIFREYPLRAGRVVVRGNKAYRDKSTVLRADYALFYKANIPLAVVEAKDNQHAVGAGMGQALNYAQLLDVPFSFSSNGDGFVFRDATLATGVLVVLGFNDRQRNVGLVEQGVVGAQHRALVAVGLAATYHHAPCPQGVLPKDLVQTVPPCLLHGGADELVADVAFGEVGFVHSAVSTLAAHTKAVCCWHRILPPLSTTAERIIASQRLLKVFLAVHTHLARTVEVKSGRRPWSFGAPTACVCTSLCGASDASTHPDCTPMQSPKKL